MAFGNHLIQKVSNNKNSIPLGGRGTQLGMAGTMQMAELEAELPPRTQAGVNCPRGWGLRWCESWDGNLGTEIGTHPPLRREWGQIPRLWRV